MPNPLQAVDESSTEAPAEPQGAGVSPGQAPEASGAAEPEPKPVEVRFAEAFRASPGGFTHVRCFFVSGEGGRRRHMLHPHLPWTAAQDLYTEVPKVHGAGWFDVAAWNDNTKKWGTQGRINVGEAPGEADEPATLGGVDVAKLAGGSETLAASLLRDVMSHNLARERSHDDDLRESRTQSFEAAQQLFQRETASSVVADVFAGLTGLANVFMDRKEQKAEEAKPDVDDDNARDVYTEIGRLMLSAVTGDWEPAVFVATLRGVYGDDETERLFANIQTVVQEAASKVPELGKALTSKKGKAWAAGVVSFVTSLQPSEDK
jgi:hypothetical protein